MSAVDPSQNHPETADTPQVLLEHHLNALRLPTMLREYDKVARQCATDSVDYPRYLLRITELELLDRERRAIERRIRQARFLVLKSLDSFEFLAIPSLNKRRVFCTNLLDPLSDNCEDPSLVDHRSHPDLRVIPVDF
jgi:DNA replication protein DnaC